MRSGDWSSEVVFSNLARRAPRAGAAGDSHPRCRADRSRAGSGWHRHQRPLAGIGKPPLTKPAPTKLGRRSWADEASLGMARRPLYLLEPVKPWSRFGEGRKISGEYS